MVWAAGAHDAAPALDSAIPSLPPSQDVCTPFGAFLDPVADKLMVCTALVLLASRPLGGGWPAWTVPAAAAGENQGVAVVGGSWVRASLTSHTPFQHPCPHLVFPVIIGREVAMSALREWAAALGGRARAAVAVSWAGKAKTAAQMVAVASLLATSGGGSGGGGAGAAAFALNAARAAGPPLLLASAALAALSLGQYVVALWPFLVGREAP